MSTTKVRSNDAREIASVENADMKLEIVVIPVSDVDRAKKFYGRLGWRLDADYVSGDDFRVIQFTPPAPGARSSSARTSPSAAPGSAQGPVPDRLRHRGRARRAGRSRRRDQRGVPLTRRRYACTDRAPASDGSRQRVRARAIAATARSPHSVIRTATAGYSRRSRAAARSDRPRRQRLSRRRTISRVPFGVPRTPTASTRNASARRTRTGPTGTPTTSCASMPARNCLRERLRRDRHPLS